jgi:hypothetical protein
MVAATRWFDVDRSELSMLLDGRDKAFILNELLQNAWDQNVTDVKVSITSSGHAKALMVVEDDDPDGFADLALRYRIARAMLWQDTADVTDRLRSLTTLALHELAAIFNVEIKP